MTDENEPMTGTIGNTEKIREHFWKALAAQPNVMLALNTASGHAVPMRAQLDERAHGKFWFFTATDSRCADGGQARALFVSKGHDLFASIDGTLVKETDETVIDHFWSNPIESWYANGRHDTKLLVLRFELDDAEIWEPEMGIVGAFKMLTGMTMKTGDAGEHATVALD